MVSLDLVAKRLRDAYREGAVPPLRDVMAPSDARTAYDIQALNTRAWQEAGRRIVGRKVGLTAKAVQIQLGVDQPDFGVLFDDMEIADGGVLDPSLVLQPKVEAEVAFILGADLTDAETTMDAAAAAVAEVVPAIEIVPPAFWNCCARSSTATSPPDSSATPQRPATGAGTTHG